MKTSVDLSVATSVQMGATECITADLRLLSAEALGPWQLKWPFTPCIWKILPPRPVPSQSPLVILLLLTFLAICHQGLDGLITQLSSLKRSYLGIIRKQSHVSKLLLFPQAGKLPGFEFLHLQSKALRTLRL